MGEEAQAEVREYRFEDDGRIPNNPNLPLLVYPGALGETERDPSRCKERLAGNGWGGAWTNGVFSYHHYHSTSHEVLCVVGGSASIAFGGAEGEVVEVEAGDVVVIPAGVGHKNRGSLPQGLLRGRGLPARPGVLRPPHRRGGRTPRGPGEHRERPPARGRSPVWPARAARRALVGVAFAWGRGPPALPARPYGSPRSGLILVQRSPLYACREVCTKITTGCLDSAPRKVGFEPDFVSPDQKGCMKAGARIEACRPSKSLVT